MIENYILMHKGGQEEYRDNIFVNYSSALTMALLYLPSETDFSVTDEASVAALVQGSSKMEFKALSESIYPILTELKNYMLIRIDDKAINIERHGKVYAYIVQNGELKMLPNGLTSLEDEDRVICCTGEFTRYLNDIAILSDAVSSDSAEEWMDNLVCRISDKNRLSEGNLTAVTMIVRSNDVIRLA
ncbi:MAG: hypothetical protein J6127_05270 [Clostridiales bacterium]|nr:hypothetical protein [Clostridiales bacterium]